MKVLLRRDGLEETLDILAPAPACRFRAGAAAEREAHVETPEPGVYSIIMDGRSYDARVEDVPGGGVVVVIDGFRFEIEVRDPRRWSRKPGGRGGEEVQSLSAPMPGKVVRVLAAPGDAVEAGQGVVVVEAMKMQNEIKAPRGGTILSLPARQGATVAAGEVLATIG